MIRDGLLLEIELRRVMCVLRWAYSCSLRRASQDPSKSGGAPIDEDADLRLYFTSLSFLEVLGLSAITRFALSWNPMSGVSTWP